jgi:uncharacterized protein (DUF362 family)
MSREESMRKINRRSFLKKSGLLGAGALVAGNIFSRPIKAMAQGSPPETTIPDMVSVKGKDYFFSTLKAVEELGGMETFVKRGDRVGLLVNSPFKNLGAYVNPDITLAMVKMCNDAGAREIRYLKDPHKGYWEKSALAAKYSDAIKSLKYESGNHLKMDIPGGISLKDAKVSKDLLDCDVLINVSIAKHHDGVHYSGALKNMMGLCPFSTNSYFHWGTLKLGWYGDLDHLSQCIADLNLVRKADLCISDATVFITENGPYGPGKLARPERVVASRNRVSLDGYCCRLLGRQPEEVLMIRKAAQHGMGEMSLEKLRVKELSV